ncbi:MAG: hypothetical protein DRQ97_04730 [Gammaproteobacteria bacterium]|nr:MAG: hypothetical protein DRQ97_04730 [Gammaproteobacteria bacterium]
MADPLTPAPTPPLPDWQLLEFEHQAFWVTARSQVEINRDSANEQQWQIIAASSVVGNSEQVTLTLDPQNGRVIKRTRLSRGKQQRYKIFDYLADYILRERRVPEDDSNQPTAEWPVTSRKKIAYPELTNGLVITDVYALLPLADRFQAGSDGSAEWVVLTDFNFYHVRMTHGADTAIAVDYQVIGGQRVTGTREMRSVTLEVNPLVPLVEKPDFSLLGLHGRITLLFDKESSIVVQLRGTAPKLGSTEINLKTVTLRKPLP